MSAKLFQKVKELNLPHGKYALFGSAPMCVRGLRDCRDVDIIVTEDLFEDYRNKSDWVLKKIESGSEYLCNDEIELWKDWGPGKWDIEQLIQEAEIIDGLPFVRLENVIKFKKLKARKKDLEDIKMLEDNLKSHEK